MKSILALAASAAMTLPVSATMLIDEDFSSGSLPAGWIIQAPAGVTYNYSAGDGLKFSDALPVTGKSTSIVPKATGERATISFLYNLPESVGDFTSTMTFSWNQNIGRPDNGSTNVNASTGILYFLLYNSEEGGRTVARTGIYDNNVNAAPTYYSAIGADASLGALGGIPYASLGQNTLTISRTGDQVIIEWLDHNGATILSRAGTNDLLVDRLYLQFSMLRTDTTASSGIGTTKFGEITVHNITFESIPEPSTISLMVGAVGIVLMFFRRHRQTL